MKCAAEAEYRAMKEAGVAREEREQRRLTSSRQWDIVR